MEFRKLANNTINFGINRIIEVCGIGIVIIAFFLLISLVSFSPDDPNFIFPNNTKIKNLLGFHGSFTADLFFQTFGLISLLIPLTLIMSGINIVLNKRIFLILEAIFYIVLYSFFGSLFFSFFYPTAFNLYINGNGGFVGVYLEATFLTSLININSQLSYYISIFIILTLFLFSIHFKINSFYRIIKKIFKFIFKKNEKNYTNKNEIISEFIPQDEIRSFIQEDLPFIKNDNKLNNKNVKFKLPTINLLKIPTQKDKGKLREEDYVDSEFLEKILLDFGVSGNIKKVSHGPVVTLNEFEPAAGVKVSKIINLSDDIARNTSSESARIATIPGRSTIGIELPNSTRENVYLSEILSNNDFNKKDIKLPIALGKNISGIPIIGDLALMPHLLIAGTTGSGKSVCINTIILSLLYRHTPDKCKFILIDPKMLELSTYEGIPHLLCPVITEAKKAASVLGWVVKEMENRYRLMTKEGVRNIDGYNKKHALAMPYIVVVVDEMSDLMLVAGKEIESYIQKLSQMARAAGIHIIMATQRPSVDVITGTIKANFPTRISFQVTSKIDSRTILGEQGAEQLLGKGDMLYMSSANRIVRIHAPFVSETEIEKVNNYLRSQAEPDYIDEVLNFNDEKEMDGDLSKTADKDELYQAALDIIRSEGKASTSFLQRKLQIGYNRAARIIDMMEADGVVSNANHVGKRDVL
ncbi:DNA translocase FtsK 4TM domain-containing protein [Candidatus Pelagibacter sp. Uisw_092]|uniref:FtsK/SpoIIIE family DNA translocase n=1 Tax=Candidatus Pelagibacter sp. Uisw_092 TaxID=3230979 RepID=UPI0039EA84F4